MSSVLELLRLAYWMRPMQRVLVLLAAALAVLALLLPAGKTPGIVLVLLPICTAIMLVSPLLSTGIYLRMLSARRTIQLLPHSRGRLLAAAILVALSICLLATLAFWLSQRPVSPQRQAGPEAYTMVFVLTFSFATLCTVGTFLGSRSPLWGLVTLGAWLLPGYVIRLAGIEEGPQVLAGPRGLVATTAIWLVFGTWFLRARSIAPSVWRGDYGVGSATAMPKLDQPAQSREEAMQRWLLGALTPIRASLVLLAGMAVVVLAQLIIGRNSPPQAAAALIFLTLSVGFVLTGCGIAARIAQRSRGLWLYGARDRAALYAWCEGRLLQYLLHLGLPLVMAGVILWALLPSRPQLPGTFVLAMSALWGCTLAWLGLAKSRGSAWVDMVLGIASALTWGFGLALALFTGEASTRWGAVVLLALLAVTARQLAVWRWHRADWPRAAAPEPAA